MTMFMKRILNKYVIPNVANEHKPHLLRETGVLALTYIIVLAFFGSLVQYRLITSPQFTAEVLPNVLVDLANDDRTDNQLAALTVNPKLIAAAKLKAKDMAANQYFAHTSPVDPSKTPWYWFNMAGYTFVAAGENLAIDFSDSSAVNEAWMDSPGHRANILNSKFSEIGIAIEPGMFEGRETIYVVQMFGKPRTVAAAQPTAPVVTQPIAREIPLQPVPASQPASVVAVNAQPSAPQVAGEAKQPEAAVLAEQTTAPESKLEVIAEEDKFIAVQEVSTGEPELISDLPTAPVAVGEPAPNYSSWSDRLLASPRKTLEYSYIALSGLILVVILLMINKEIERHHLKHILYGLLLLVLMYILLSASKAILVGEVLVK